MSTSTNTSAHKPSPTANTKPNRLPAPTLFVGPPSRNASQLSIARPTSETKNPLSRQKSALGRSSGADFTGEGRLSGSGREASTPQPRKASERSIDARWREMQNTLDEVELNAQSSTHVFGESHARALDELRMAQVELARAWGRGDEEKGVAAGTDDMPVLGGGVGGSDKFQTAAELAAERAGHAKGRKRGDTDASVSTTLSDESVLSDNTRRSGRSQLEDETAEDIRLASERRAANEAYFRKVDESVKEVVAKLEVVADAMRGVEGESRSLWSATETLSSSEDGEGKRTPVVVEPA